MKIKKVYKFNIWLIIVAILTIVNSVILEIATGAEIWGLSFHTWVWMHIVLCIICSLMVFYHLYIHWGRMGAWFKTTNNLNNKVTRCLVYLSLAAFITGVISMIMFILNGEHNATGIIHGKIGILLILITIQHTIKRLKWFRGRTTNRAMQIIIDGELCVGCGLCVKKCPANILKKEGKCIIVNNTDFCIQCMKCINICPKKAITSDKSEYSSKSN